MWFCSECGKKNNGKYCTRCGTKYVEVDESVSSLMPKENYGMMLDSELPSGFSESPEEEEIFSAASLFRRDHTDSHIPDFQSYLNSREQDAEVEDTPVAGFSPCGDLPEWTEEPEPVETVSEEETVEEVTVEAEVIPAAVQEEEKIEPAPKKIFVEDENKAFLWNDLFRHDHDLAETENGIAEYTRGLGKKEVLVSEEEEVAADSLEIGGVFAHRKPKENNADREWRFSKRLIIAVGSVVGVMFLAVAVLIGSLMVSVAEDENLLPESTGIYCYVSGVKDATPLYADKSIKSDVLAELENGDALEFLEEVNSRFTFVYDKESGHYGYVKSAHLVANKSDVDDGTVENIYANEKSLGYFYVTKVDEYLNLWENPDGGGVVKAKLENGFKVSLLEKTNDKYWYVFDYNAAERGYVRCSYLTDDIKKVVGMVKEPKDKTVIGDYYVTGVKNYLTIYAKPKSGSEERGRLKNGDKVGLIQKTNSSYWYVSGNGVYGWVAAKYLTATDPNPAPEPEPTPPPADTTNDYKVFNTKEYLPVLKDPKVGGEELAQIHNGDVVTFIKEYDDKFWYVKIPSLNIEGYVAKEYLTK